MIKQNIHKLVCMLAAALLGLVASLPALGADPLKVGFVYVSPIGLDVSARPRP